MHAVTSIATERTRTSRVGWSLLLTIAIVILTWQVWNIAVKLQSCPTSTDTTISYESPMRFPAVTICNLNPMKYTEIFKFSSRKPTERDESDNPADAIMSMLNTKIIRFLIYDPLTQTLPTPEPTEQENEKSFAVYGPQTNCTPAPLELKRRKWYRGIDATMRRPDVIRKDLVMLRMNSMNERDVGLITYPLDDILMDCSFLGKNCDRDRDFVRIMNPRYGACYIFNSGANASKTPVKTITNSGTDKGLELTLDVIIPEYLPGIATDVGFKILIHDQANPPMPDRDGFMVRPGAFTMLGLRATEIERAEEPYGKCKHFSHEENERRNMFLDILPMTSPTMTTCMRTCEQAAILDNCGCYSLQHGYSSAPAFKAFNDSVRRRACDLNDNSDDYKCLTKVLELQGEADSFCKSSMCAHHECKSRRFDVSQSMSVWPAEESLKQMKNPLNLKIKTFREGRLKVLVYFEDLNVIRIKAQPSYQVVDFLSDLGGQGGLWLGMSAFTAVEFLVLLGDFLRRAICYFFLNHRQRQSDQRDNSKEETEKNSEELLGKDDEKSV